MKLISIVTGCYNEEENVEELYTQIKAVFSGLPQYRYEHIFIDNCSEDRTVAILKTIAEKDHNVKVIVNTRNFGHIRSPTYALLQARGDAVISMVSDLQDPPHLIKDFLQEWEKGSKIVVGVKAKTEESFLLKQLRCAYYALITKISHVPLLKNFTGFGLYDKVVIDALREMNDPYPYVRGLICDIGYPIKQILYNQPRRYKGVTKNNIYTLYDMAMLGITNHSKLPLRVIIFLGFFLSLLSFIVSFIFFILKIMFWKYFSLGFAPLLIGLFFLFSIILFFLGLLGEYILAIQTQVMHRPLVFVKEKINFDSKQ